MLFLFLLLTCALAAVPNEKYVRTYKDNNGKWWFTQGGKVFLTLGINHVNNGGPDDGVDGRESSQCQKILKNPLCGDTLSFAKQLGFSPYFNSTMDRWGTQQKWAMESANRLKAWNFNSIGGWSATIAEKAVAFQGLYYAHLLDIGTTWFSHSTGTCFQNDVFDQAFYDLADKVAQKACTPRANDEYLIGYQLDNEVQWRLCGIVSYLGLSTQGSTACLNWLKKKYVTIGALDSAWHVECGSWDQLYDVIKDNPPTTPAFNTDTEEWEGVVATHYFNTTTTLIKKYDPNHLILGIRGMDFRTDYLINSTRGFVDVFDVHDYADSVPLKATSKIHEYLGVPVMIGEFSFTAYDGNVPNAHGARSCTTQPHCPKGYPWGSQNQRATAFEQYMTPFIQQPYAVGFHWWQWMDEPWDGRWPDGENSNYGVVHVSDDIYGVLTDTMAAFNEKAAALHTNSV